MIYQNITKKKMLKPTGQFESLGVPMVLKMLQRRPNSPLLPLNSDVRSHLYSLSEEVAEDG